MWRKPVTVHYRRFTWDTNPPRKSFEELVRQAAEHQPQGSPAKLKERYRLRMLRRDEDSLFINALAVEKDYLFGDITHFTKDQTQALFDDSKEDAPMADVQQLPKPENGELIHSLMYWMVKNDHVFLLQSQSLRTEAAEEYFSWLLADKTGVLPKGVKVVFASKFDAQAVGGDLEDIREVIVGGTVTRQAGPESLPTETVVEESGGLSQTLLAGWLKARKVLVALIDNEADVEKIMQKLPEDGSLSVEVHIGYKTKKRKMSRAILKDLEVGLRNLPDSQLQVRGKDGRQAPDGTVRLQHPASVLFVTHGEGEAKRPTSLLQPEDVLRSMLEAYNVFVSNGKITDGVQRGQQT
ncbi:hypothetical protein [Desulfocurvus vexinensis]|uniref:hypothetical protein n=1 Tax=Desulfocurvus vexinensis TaxID=399548 RepID=UPI0012EC5DD3|nr:hypothetical protein [Desulfocurvus vexinensis]